MSMDIGKPSADTVVVKRQLLVIQPEQMECGCVQIVNGDRVLHRPVS